MSWYCDPSEKLKGKVLESWQCNFSDELVLYFTDDSCGTFFHSQECCESVSITSTELEISKLDECLGKVLTSYCEDIDYNTTQDISWHIDPFTNTTQIFNFEGVELKIKWVGESNGYYSESVDFGFREAT